MKLLLLFFCYRTCKIDRFLHIGCTLYLSIHRQVLLALSLSLFHLFYIYMVALQNIHIQYQKKKRKKRKAPSKRKSSVLKEKEITLDEQSKIHQTFINISTGKATKHRSYMLFLELHIYISELPFIAVWIFLFFPHFFGLKVKGKS